MGLDITFKTVKPVLCPHCGELVSREVTDCEDAGGSGWYPFLESIGYYVPYDKRTDENDWYGKDMELNDDQIKELYRFVKQNGERLYGGQCARSLAVKALLDEECLVVNADW